MSKIEGLAKIELTDVKTGKVKTQYEHNLVTNFLQKMYSKVPFDTPFDFSNDLIDCFNGVALFSDNIKEDPNIIHMPILPTAWAGNVSNTGRGTNRGSINTTETKVLDNGYQFCWEFNTSQGNGTYKCLGLTSAIACNIDDFGLNCSHKENGGDSNVYRIDHFPGIHYLGDFSYSVTLDDIPMAVYSSPDYIDEDNDYFYKIVPNRNGTTLTVYRIKRYIYKKAFNQTRIKSNNGCYYSNLESCSVIVNDPIINWSNNLYASVHVYNGYYYIISFKRNPSDNNNILITKIKISSLFTGNIEVNQETKEFPVETSTNLQLGYNFNDDEAKCLYSCISNKLAFKYPYVYLARDIGNNIGEIYAINITNESDYFKLNGQFEIVANDNSGSHKFIPHILIGDFIVKPNSYMISTNEKKLVKGGFQYWDIGISGNSRGGTISLNDDIYSLTPNYLLINPFNLVTINNVTPFTKTSDQTMKITYTLTLSN